MENRENLRVRQTRHRLSEALMEMPMDRSLRSVSIRELCQRAGINRTTFYNHYGSQYDLFEEICAQFLEDIADCLASADPENREHVHEKVALVLTYLQDHLQVARLLLNHSEMPGFADRLFSLPKVGRRSSGSFPAWVHRPGTKGSHHGLCDPWEFSSADRVDQPGGARCAGKGECADPGAGRQSLPVMTGPFRPAEKT